MVPLQEAKTKLITNLAVSFIKVVRFKQLNLVIPVTNRCHCMSPENSKYPMVSQYGNTISRKLKLLKDLHPYGVSLIYPSSKTLTYKIHRKREKQKHQP